ncbi:MAG: acetyl-CoA carboxylase biotin carboxyl carrier protein [Verrucomicrobiae bacterium]|nr:acetyl-CoA carboxylase biotin carboxyl carrier protein [Verrucomicrobiae bacterium]
MAEQPLQKEVPVDLKDIKAIIDLMKKNSISEFELEKGQEFKIRLKRAAGGAAGSGAEEGGIPAYVPVVASQAPAAVGAVAPAPSAPVPAVNEVEIKSPMIGTFYRAPSPESAAYVEVGTEVNPDTVVCIIEPTPRTNEIKAEMRGVITAVLVDNAKPVEFGQPLFKVRPL